MTEIINDVFNSFYSKIRKEAALLHVQMLELNNAMPCEQTNTNCCPPSECNMNALKELEGRVMEIVKGLETRLESSFKHRFELIEKTIATLMESLSSDDEHAPVAPEPVANTIKIPTPKQALPIPTKEVSPIQSANTTPVVSEAEAEEEEAEEAASTAAEEEAASAVAEEASEEEEEAASAVAEEEEEEEEEENELTEFQFRGKTYYLDDENNVYGLDADGELIQEPVGVRDEKTGRIRFTVSV